MSDTSWARLSTQRGRRFEPRKLGIGVLGFISSLSPLLELALLGFEVKGVYLLGFIFIGFVVDSLNVAY